MADATVSAAPAAASTAEPKAAADAEDASSVASAASTASGTSAGAGGAGAGSTSEAEARSTELKTAGNTFFTGKSARQQRGWAAAGACFAWGAGECDASVAVRTVTPLPACTTLTKHLLRSRTLQPGH